MNGYDILYYILLYIILYYIIFYYIIYYIIFYYIIYYIILYIIYYIILYICIAHVKEKAHEEDAAYRSLYKKDCFLVSQGLWNIEPESREDPFVCPTNLLVWFTSQIQMIGIYWDAAINRHPLSKLCAAHQVVIGTQIFYIHIN